MTASEEESRERFRLDSDRFLAGLAGATDVIDAAVAVLACSDDAPESLVAVASTAPGATEMEQFVQLVGKARGDLSLPWLSQTDLASIRARLRLAEMATGRVAPVEGANRLWADRETFGDPFGVLPQLIELVDRWETSLDERDSIEDEIRAVARGALM